MSAKTIIETVVKLITEKCYDQAVSTWREGRDAHGKCTLCFYTAFDGRTRCASCLEGHLELANLKCSYPSVGPEKLAQAQKELSAWIEEVQAQAEA